MVDAGVLWLKNWSRWPPVRLEGYRGRGWGGHLFHVKEAAMVPERKGRGGEGERSGDGERQTV